jgi:hypothetical protein
MVSVWKPEVDRPLGRPSADWMIILNWILKKWDEVYGLDLSGLRYGHAVGCCQQCNVPPVSIKDCDQLCI